MTIKKTTVLRIVQVIAFAFFAWVGFTVDMMAESRPSNLAGKVLQIELDAYIADFATRINLGPDKLQWAVLVVPQTETGGPAGVYTWMIPGKLLLAMFTFDQHQMLNLLPSQRRVITAHEIGHAVSECRIKPPDTTGMNEAAKYWAHFHHRLQRESCADIVSVKLTTPDEVLSLLNWLRTVYAPNNLIVPRRIEVVKKYLDTLKETQNVE